MIWLRQQDQGRRPSPRQSRIEHVKHAQRLYRRSKKEQLHIELSSAVKATVCPIRDVSPIETLYVKIYDITLLLQCSYRVGPAAHYSVPEILVSLDVIGVTYAYKRYPPQGIRGA